MKTTLDTPEKLQVLNEKLNQLVGLECWNVSRAYGGQYYFDFGKRRNVGNGKFMGEYFLSTWGTDFTIHNAEKFIIDTSQEDIGEDDIKVRLKKIFEENIVSKTIRSFEVDYSVLSLTITFNNSYRISIIPTQEDEIHELPYWEVNFPAKQSLEVGPKRLFIFKQLK